MLRLFAPAGVAVLAITSLTVWSWAYSDILGSSAISPEELDKRFASVPMTVGPWWAPT